VVSSDDHLVGEYLRRLQAAASGLPADRRRDLIEEITTHIADARAADPAQPGGVRTILDQLGDPEEIVRAAGATPPPGSGRAGGLEVFTVVTLLIGGLVVPVVAGSWAPCCCGRRVTGACATSC
jgi:hypothetical protein